MQEGRRREDPAWMVSHVSVSSPQNNQKSLLGEKNPKHLKNSDECPGGLNMINELTQLRVGSFLSFSIPLIYYTNEQSQRVA